MADSESIVQWGSLGVIVLGILTSVIITAIFSGQRDVDGNYAKDSPALREAMTAAGYLSVITPALVLIWMMKYLLKMDWSFLFIGIIIGLGVYGVAWNGLAVYQEKEADKTRDTYIIVGNFLAPLFIPILLYVIFREAFMSGRY